MICNICNQPIGEDDREHRTNQGLVYHEWCYLKPLGGATLAEALDEWDGDVERYLKQQES